MKTFMAAVAMGWLLIWCAGPALAMQCREEVELLPNGGVRICQVCCAQYGGCTRQCF